MSLNKQVQIYSLETNAFYTDAENAIDHKLSLLRHRKSVLKNQISVVNDYNNGILTKDKALKRIFDLGEGLQRALASTAGIQAHTEYEKIECILSGTKRKQKKKEIIDILGLDDSDVADKLNYEISETSKQIAENEDRLKQLMKHTEEIRSLRDTYLNGKNVISVFESELTRTLKMNIDELSDNLIIIRVFYFDVAESLVVNGFLCNNERYVYLTSSAGQIRTKKMVFIKESLWLKHKNTIMCGLSLEKINSKGGINRNKYLAYTALCNSATDRWDGFDMTKAIVVEDLETVVTGEVDFFNDKTYEITRQVMDIPIAHTDGCGMMLPSVSQKSRMFRAPWVKGLLVPFDFLGFINELGGNPTVKDIYGREYNIIRDDIRVIFTKSQFKMWKYYNSWKEYIECYEKHGCNAGYCNEEPDQILNAKINYQMLQTLTDISDEELAELAKQTNYKIKNITSNIDTVKEVFGASEISDKSTYLQQAINLYLEILGDVYTKEKIKLIKASIIKNARAGKLNLDAKYTFIIPDLFAFCEFLFLGEKNPNGLLENGEVFCSLYKKSKELDCLRSPHLYKEHAIRNNAYAKEKAKWFITKGLYVSCKDLISKLIMNDWDGDNSLVCSDKLLIEIAKRNMQGVVPLYYEMASASADAIDNKKLFEGLTLAFVSGNIGEISNDITKIENSANVDWDMVKILCAENNYVIDYAKTLYKPQRPKEVDAKIRKLTNSKVPYFFKFAKDKADHQIESINASTVNRLHDVVKSGRLNFRFKDCNFDYRMLMKDKDVDVIRHGKICEVYELFKNTTYNSSSSTEKAIEKRIANFRSKRELFVKHFYDPDLIADVLVKYLYKDGTDSKYKDVLWYCFGEELVKNLTYNLERRYFRCEKCGKKFYAEHWNQRYCKVCSTYKPKGMKTIACCDCGDTFQVDARNMTKVRCDECSKTHKKRKRSNNITA